MERVGAIPGRAGADRTMTRLLITEDDEELHSLEVRALLEAVERALSKGASS